MRIVISDSVQLSTQLCYWSVQEIIRERFKINMFLPVNTIVPRWIEVVQALVEEEFQVRLEFCAIRIFKTGNQITNCILDPGCINCMPKRNWRRRNWFEWWQRGIYLPWPIDRKICKCFDIFLELVKLSSCKCQKYAILISYTREYRNCMNKY